jgi:hypothetical protein
MHSGSLLAQELGPLLPAGPSSQQSPPLEPYAVEVAVKKPPAAIVFCADTNKDGKVAAWVFDENRDGKWDYSLWDTDFDGKPDMKGLHPDGKLEPTRYERYQPKS